MINLVSFFLLHLWRKGGAQLRTTVSTPESSGFNFTLTMTYSLALLGLTTRSIWLAWSIFLLKKRSASSLKTCVRSRQGSRETRTKHFTETLLRF